LRSVNLLVSGLGIYIISDTNWRAVYGEEGSNHAEEAQILCPKYKTRTEQKN
jgi:hypothetical protein